MEPPEFSEEEWKQIFDDWHGLGDFAANTNEFLARRTGFNRQPEATNANIAQQRVNGSPSPSPTTFSPTMSTQDQATTTGSNTALANENSLNGPGNQIPTEQPKFFFREKYAKLGVKGNFMPLAAKPVNVELGDWLAHQGKSV